MSRRKAAAIHLSISAAIGLVAAILIFGVWYPPPYSRAIGALELVALLLGVDLVLGPLLTLIVFKSGKKSLKFDLSVIALLQASAFLYGASVVVHSRPAFVVAAVDRFVVVAANDLDAADLAKAKPDFDSIPWNGPRVVGAEIPAGDSKAHSDMMFSGLAGKDFEKFPQYYVDYAQVAPKLLQRANPLDVLIDKHAAASPLLHAWLRSHSRDGSKVVWVPLETRRMSLVMLLDRDSGEPLDALPIDPW